MNDNKKCRVNGCDRKIAVVKHGLCKAHANRYYWNGHPGTGEILKRKRHAPFNHEASKIAQPVE